MTWKNIIDRVFLSQTCFETEFRDGFSSAEWFGTQVRESLFHGTEVPDFFSERCEKNWFYEKSCSSKHNWQRVFVLNELRNWISGMVSLPRNDSERNSESFLFRGTAGIPPEQTNFSVYSVFRGIIFCRKLPTLSHTMSVYTNDDQFGIYCTFTWEGGRGGGRSERR